jgi:hypothetical protein
MTVLSIPVSVRNGTRILWLNSPGIIHRSMGGHTLRYQISQKGGTLKLMRAKHSYFRRMTGVVYSHAPDQLGGIDVSVHEPKVLMRCCTV